MWYPSLEELGFWPIIVGQEHSFRLGHCCLRPNAQECWSALPPSTQAMMTLLQERASSPTYTGTHISDKVLILTAFLKCCQSLAPATSRNVRSGPDHPLHVWLSTPISVTYNALSILKTLQDIAFPLKVPLRARMPTIHGCPGQSYTKHGCFARLRSPTIHTYC